MKIKISRFRTVFVGTAIGLLPSLLFSAPEQNENRSNISDMTHEATIDPEIQSNAIKEDGYRGIWFRLNQHFEYGPKYSGGLGTYTANHIPLAIYAEEVDKTFFVYGG